MVNLIKSVWKNTVVIILLSICNGFFIKKKEVKKNPFMLRMFDLKSICVEFYLKVKGIFLQKIFIMN